MIPDRVVAIILYAVVIGVWISFVVLILRWESIKDVLAERLLDRALQARKRALKDVPDTIVTAPDIVISYRPNPEKLEVFAASGGGEGISKTLLEIVTANPDADLAKFADALGILVTNVERRKPPEKAAEPNEVIAAVRIGRQVR